MKLSELFDKRYIKCFWEDGLEEIPGYCGDFISNLFQKAMNEEPQQIQHNVCPDDNGFEEYPFQTLCVDVHGSKWYKYMYADPNWEAKRAWYENKPLEVLTEDNWVMCTEDEPEWNDRLYRPFKEHKQFKLGDVVRVANIIGIVTAMNEDKSRACVGDGWYSLKELEHAEEH